MFRPAYIFIVILMLAVSPRAQKLPADIERCTHSDNRCFSRVATSILPTHCTGHGELNIVPLDPLHVENMTLDKIPGSPVSVQIEFRNIDLIGLSARTVLNVSTLTTAASDLVFEIQTHYPKVIMMGPYSVEGCFIGNNIFGQGNAEITFYDLIITTKAKCTTPERRGKRQSNIDDIQLDLQPKLITTFLGNLYNGDNVLGDNMNQLINDNWELVFAELKPLLEKSFAKLAADLNLTFS